MFTSTVPELQQTIRLLAENLSGRASLREKQKNFNAQEEDGHVAEGIDPSYVNAYIAVAKALVSAGDVQTAIRYLRLSCTDPRLDDSGRAKLKEMLDNLQGRVIVA